MLQKLSYLNKLTLSSVLSTAVAISFLFAAFIWYLLNESRQSAIETTQLHAQLVAINAANAMINGETEILEKNLVSLKKHSPIVAAQIQSQTGERLVSFGNISNEDVSAAPGKAPHLTPSDTIILSEPITGNNNTLLGSVIVKQSLKIQQKELNKVLLVAVSALIFAALLSYCIWVMTQKLWSKSFNNLTQEIKRITLTKNYATRLFSNTHDEIGQLTAGFNNLLEQIEDQNQQLVQDQQHLESIVATRTNELRTSNQDLLNVISEKSVTEANLLKLSSAVTQAEEAVLITDQDGYIEYVNPSFERVTGYSPSIAIGQKPSILKSDMHDAQFYANVWQNISAGNVYRGVFINSRPNGDTYHLEQSIAPIMNAKNSISHYVATGRDITERINNEKSLEYLAQHDSLTGLPNRGLLSTRIDKGIASCKNKNMKLAVMLIDLDGFKMTNDIFGHDVGDILLKTVASRLSTIVRSQDSVARISGDEFAVVLSDITSQADSGAVARKLLDSLSEPYLIHAKEVLVTASVGISIYPDDSDDSRTLLKHADLAMYSAKNAGKARFEFYSSQAHERDSFNLEMEHKILHAVKFKEFHLHYQPLLRTEDYSCYGVEALLRWTDNEGLVHFPNVFISHLEDTGLIEEVGAWVLMESCKQLSEWNKSGYKNLIMSVNVSPRQLQNREFVTQLKDALTTTGINPEHLQLEITERLFLAFSEINIQLVREISALGVKIAVDDFGMGHSSLVYLSKLPIDSLKIDRSFVQNIDTNEDDLKIVSALIALAERLNLVVTAEGIETQAQLKVIQELKCEISQGYLFARPMPKEHLNRWLRENILTPN